MPLITKTCPNCHVEFSGQAFNMRKRTYCSQACYHSAKAEDITGMRFGSLVAIRPEAGKKWLVRCDCGKEVVRKTQGLRNGTTKSCGCVKRPRQETLAHHAGGKKTRAYRIWDGIVQRCTNPNNKAFSNYGGRGIAIDDAWLVFNNFLSDMGIPPENASIERIDNDSGYNKSNCKWASKTEQQRNRRTNNRITYNGESLCLVEWAERFNISDQRIRSRLNLGWTFEEAVGIVSRVSKQRTGLVRPNARWVEFNGERLILEDWCRRLNLNSKTVHSRLARGATELKALGLE